MGPRDGVTLLELVDALILFDNLMLDHRFQQAVHDHPVESIRKRLADLPSTLAEGSRQTRRAGVKWEDVTGTQVDPDTARSSDYFLLNAVLQAAEEQVRLKVFLARRAPTREVRDLLDDALAKHRVLSETLRDALKALGAPVPERDASWAESAPVGVEDASGDLRGQIEREVRHLQHDGTTPKSVHLSPTAVRHLRDQGLFQNGDCTVEGVPVVVELAWTRSEFAISTFDSVPLEELVSREGG